jgi:hypothetical protein
MSKAIGSSRVRGALVRELGVDTRSHRADASTHDGVVTFWTFVKALDRPIDGAVLNVGIPTGGAFVDIALGHL